MATRDELAAGSYLSLTTYRRSGAAVSCPVWVVPASDGRLGVCTSTGTGKTVRLAHTPRVAVQPCDVRGRTLAGSTPSRGTAEMVRSGGHFDEVRAKVGEKYGVMATLSRLLATVGRHGRTVWGRPRWASADTVVLVRLDPPA